jgi:putative transposase
VRGLLPLQHPGDALLGDHGHPPQAGHHPHPRIHRGAGSQAGSGRARILSATVSRSAQRWFVSFTVEVDRDLPDRHPRPGTAVGVDVGLKALVIAVDHRGRVIQVPGPRPLGTALRRLRRVCRAHSRKQKGSANRRKSARRLAAPCPDHQLPGHPRSQLRRDPRRLARSLSDRAFGELRRQLGYKTSWRGGRLIVADRFFPSFKPAQACGMVKAKLSLAERVFACEEEVRGPHEAGLVGSPVRPRRHAGHTAIKGVTAKPTSRGAKQEPGAAQAGKSGTAIEQSLATSRMVTHDH